MKSRILMSEEVANKARKFGSNLEYYPAKIVLLDGKKINALFTLDQLKEAMERANTNPEDMPKKNSSLWDWLFD